MRRNDFLADFRWGRFELHWNEGFFTGVGSDTSPLMSQVFLSSLSLLIIALISLIGFLYRKEGIRGFIPSLWLLGIGLFSNVKDRIFLGRVTDWVILKAGILENYAFNLADLLIGTGVLILSYLVIFQSQRFWRDSQFRDRILIEKKFQFGLAWFVVKGAFLISLFMTLTSLIFFRLYLLSPETPIRFYGYLFGGVAFLWIIIGWTAGIIYSRNLFGPVLALEKLIERVLQGKTTERDRFFRLRKSDSFQRLTKLGQAIIEKSISERN